MTSPYIHCDDCGRLFHSEEALALHQQERHGWQPRYLAYARAHGLSPEEMLAQDREAWPGGLMAGYITWINDEWADFDRDNGRPVHNPEYHARFDGWLQERHRGREHDGECATLCPVPAGEKCRIGHACWCTEQPQGQGKLL